MKFRFIKDFILDKKIFLNIFFATLISGVFSHIMGLTNIYSYHDDIGNFFDIGVTYGSGRFSLKIIYKLLYILNGGSFYNLYFLNGIITIIIIGIVNYFIIKILEIKNKYIMILISILMVTSPSITSLLGYRFAAPYYQFGLLIGIISIYLFINNDKNDIKIYILSIIMMVFSIGIYQAYISFYLSLTMLYILNKSLKYKLNVIETFKRMIPHIIYYIVSFLIYLLSLMIVLKVKNTHLLSYKNIDTFGAISINEYLIRIINSYKYYFNVFIDEPFNIFVLGTRYFYYILFTITIFSIFIKKQNKSNILGGGVVLVLILFPMCVQFNFIMSGSNTTLQNQSMIFEIILLLFLIDKLDFIKNIKIYIVSMVIVAFVCFQFIVYSNMCYTKANFLISQTVSYNNTLITRIKSTENYKDNMKVCYINEFDKNKNDIYLPEQFKRIYINYYNVNSLINNYAWRWFMSFYTGYKPDVVDEEKFIDDYRVKSMSTYPNDGSIKIIDDVVVVKFK